MLDAFLDEQLKAFEKADIHNYFWSWRMPQGKNFQPGWSFKYIMGLEETYHGSTCQQPSQPRRRRSEAACTHNDRDPYETGAHVACCKGSHEENRDWHGDNSWTFRCVGATELVI